MHDQKWSQLLACAIDQMIHCCFFRRSNVDQLNVQTATTENGTPWVT